MMNERAGGDFTVHLPATLATTIDMVADEHGVSRDHAATILIATGVVCRANHDGGIDDQIAVAETLASLSGGGDEGRLKRISPPERP